MPFDNPITREDVAHFQHERAARLWEAIVSAAAPGATAELDSIAERCLLTREFIPQDAKVLERVGREILCRHFADDFDKNGKYKAVYFAAETAKQGSLNSKVATTLITVVDSTFLGFMHGHGRILRLKKPRTMREFQEWYVSHPYHSGLCHCGYHMFMRHVHRRPLMNAYFAWINLLRSSVKNAPQELTRFFPDFGHDPGILGDPPWFQRNTEMHIASIATSDIASTAIRDAGSAVLRFANEEIWQNQPLGRRAQHYTEIEAAINRTIDSNIAPEFLMVLNSSNGRV